MIEISGLAELRRVSHNAHYTAVPAPPNFQVVCARGDLDAASAPSFLRFTLGCLRPNRPLVVDLREVDFCGVAGISALDEVARSAQDAGAPLTVVCNGTIRRHMTAVGVGQGIRFSHTVEEALESPDRQLLAGQVLTILPPNSTGR